MRTTYLVVFVAVTVIAAVADAQVVQLPTFRQFSVGTTVVVPDRGAAYLGGVSRRRAASSSHGFPGLGPLSRNRSFGVETGGSHASVTATIHDFAAMDRALLGTAPPPLSEDDRKVAFLVRHLGRPGSRPFQEIRSVAEIRSTRASLARRTARPLQH